MARHRDLIESLLQEADDLETEFAQWQEPGRHPTDAEVRAGARAYTSWFARSLRFVPESEQATFRDMYEGGAIITRIRAFLSEPTARNAMWDPQQPNPFVDEFQHPFQSNFRANLDRQRAILVMAMDAEAGIVNVLDELAVMFLRLPEFIAVFQSRQNDRVVAPSIESEADLQVLVEAILRLHYDDVRPEDYVPSHAGARSRVDFLLKDSGVVIETKMTRERLRDRGVGEELTIDWKRYERHPDCRAIFALVFDPGRFIANPAGLERDLTQVHTEPATRVIVVR